VCRSPSRFFRRHTTALSPTSCCCSIGWRSTTSPSIAPVHFWAGSALFVKARDEEDPEIRLGWLGRAAEEFRKALELTPDDWDTKYNYELTSRLLDELRKQPKTPPKQMLQLLRPEPKTGGRPPRRVG
jgi:hypothetical protein